jgi:hypothetical protein
MSVLPQLERELLAAHARRAARRRGWGPSALRTRLPAGNVHRLPARLAPALGVLVALAVGAVALLALSHGRQNTAAQPKTFPDAPGSQIFAPFSRCRRAPPSRYLPPGAECVTVTRADVDGDGFPDLVLLYTTPHSNGAYTLEVLRAWGGELSARVSADMNAAIALVRTTGAHHRTAVFVHDSYSTTDQGVTVYAFNGHALTKAGVFEYGGQDAGIVFGFTCLPSSRSFTPAGIIQHEFDERTPFKNVWDRTDRAYAWRNGRLSPTGVLRFKAKPTSAELGIHC